MATAIVGLGTNLGAREASIRSAALLLDARAGVDVAITSPLYETEPVGPPQGLFLNAALRVETSLRPHELLRLLLRTERRMGRVRDPDARWGPRAIDLDLLWFDGVELSTEGLTVPHPGLKERPFALRPLLDVAPELGVAYAETLESLGPTLVPWDRAAVVSHHQDKTVVEADDIADALCIAAIESFPCASPATRGASTCRATRETVTAADPSSWTQALQHAIDIGLQPHAISVSHCSESQWTVSIHGAPLPAKPISPVCVEVASGAERTHRVTITHAK